MNSITFQWYQVSIRNVEDSLLIVIIFKNLSIEQFLKNT
jgi:hypothetical protein